MTKIATAKLNYLRIAPRKARLVANLIKGRSANEAEAQLALNPKKAAEAVLKLLRSAIANSKQKEMKAENLFVKEIRVDQGPSLKRFMPRAQGRATTILKRSSHISLILGEAENPKTSRFKIVKPKKIRKEKIEKIRAEREAKKPKLTEKETIKGAEKPGFVKKMFRRKSV